MRELNKRHHNKDWLYNQYVTLHKSCPKIALEFDTPRSTIQKWLKVFEIPMRKSSEYIQPKGKNHWNWKGGFYIAKNGYRKIYAPNHPRSDPKGYVSEHIVKAERKLERALAPGEVVHHVNHNKCDNRPSNLMVFSSATEHSNFEKNERMKKVLSYGKICPRCKLHISPQNLAKPRMSICKICEKKRILAWRLKKKLQP